MKPAFKAKFYEKTIKAAGLLPAVRKVCLLWPNMQRILDMTLYYLGDEVMNKDGTAPLFVSGVKNGLECLQFLKSKKFDPCLYDREVLVLFLTGLFAETAEVFSYEISAGDMRWTMEHETPFYSWRSTHPGPLAQVAMNGKAPSQKVSIQRIVDLVLDEKDRGLLEDDLDVILQKKDHSCIAEHLNNFELKHGWIVGAAANGKE